jgi:DNA-binding NtrC family response regulator
VNDARILVVDDEANIRNLLDEILSEEGFDVTTAEDAAHAREARRHANFDLTLLDIWMPDTDGISLLKEWADSGSLGPVVMMSGHGTVDTAVEATRLGALDFIEKPVSLNQLLRTVNKALAIRPAAGQGLVRSPLSAQLVGKSRSMSELRERIAAVAQHEITVLFTGEPGSGRTRAARHLASLAARSAGPFEIIGGDELSAADVRGRLFGDGERSGALDRAAAGILFIPGINRVVPQAQGVLLEALATGGGAGIAADVRVLASAPPGFERDANFRSDLMSLIGSVVVRVPPLRDHAEDVPELLRYFTERFVDLERLPFRRFGIAVQNRLRNYPWPGNVLELRHLVKQMLVLDGDEEIGLREVEGELAADATDAEPLIKKDLLAMPLREAREHFERAYLQQQLQLCGGKVGQLAKRVGMERTHLYRKLRALGVDFRQAGQDD